MRASLVITALNEGDRLWRTVQSCLETTVDLDRELIVVDDASTDGSIGELLRRFPGVHVRARRRRGGVAPARCLGARSARGDVLIFLDGHCKPEPGAIAQLVDDVERLHGRAIVNPRIAVLDERTWQNHPEDGVGHGFQMDLETLDRRWIALERMRLHRGECGRFLYESPALAGCCAALSRDLYAALGGFDAGMRMWGAEDLDLGLKAWLTGYQVLHDPEPVVGHRFRTQFDNFEAPVEHVIANELRLARKHFGEVTWLDWVERCKARSADAVWPAAWGLFEQRRAVLERERAALLARRDRDEFWYAERFDLWWPRWLAGRKPEPGWEYAPPVETEALFEKHARQPRHRAVLPDAGLVGAASEPGLGKLTLYLKLTRARSGEVFLERATFQADDHPALVACGSCLTHRIEGESLARARAIEPESLLEALGALPEQGPPNPACLDRSRSARLAVWALRTTLARL